MPVKNTPRAVPLDPPSKPTASSSSSSSAAGDWGDAATEPFMLRDSLLDALDDPDATLPEPIAAPKKPPPSRSVPQDPVADPAERWSQDTTVPHVVRPRLDDDD